MQDCYQLTFTLTQPAMVLLHIVLVVIALEAALSLIGMALAVWQRSRSEGNRHA